MGRVTTKDLRGLLSAIDCMQGGVENGATDPGYLADAEGANRCYDWVLSEINRREGRKLVRRSVKRAQ